MSDTPCVDGCGQDAATIERLREQLAAVESLADEWERRASETSPAWSIYGPQNVSVPFAVQQIRAVLTPQDGPRSAAHAPEAPGQPGRDEGAAGGRVEALARALRSVGVEVGYAGADTYRTVVAERILADPGPLLEALAEAGVLTRVTDTLPPRRDPMYPRRGGVHWAAERYVSEWQPDRDFEAADARP